MRIVETITATGKGYWGMPMTFTLATVEYTLIARHENRSEKHVRYEIQFKLEGGLLDSRRFLTEAERTEFLNRSFSDLELIPAKSPLVTREREYFLIRLVGEPLTSVNFVLDYLQLQFGEDHHFNIELWPVIHKADKTYTRGETEYEHSLCSLTGKAVIDADEFLDAGLVFDFGPDGSIELDLNPEDYPYPEIATYHRQDGFWTVWRPGKVTF